jgi:hypothetical protein
MKNINNVITELKKDHSHIYSVSESNGTEYLFRSLTLKEVKNVEEFITKKLKSSFEIENYCLENCLLYPEGIDLDDISPGAAKQIADEILTVSGVTNADFILEAMAYTRDRLAGDLILSIKAYIISAIPAYSDSDLDNFTLLELIEKLVHAETILTLQARMAGMEGEVRLNFESTQDGEQNTEAIQPKQQPKPKKQDRPLPSKEELVSRINSKTTDNRAILPREKDFEGFDPETLERMAGVASADDPLARKLHGIK